MHKVSRRQRKWEGEANCVQRARETEAGKDPKAWWARSHTGLHSLKH